MSSAKPIMSADRENGRGLRLPLIISAPIHPYGARRGLAGAQRATERTKEASEGIRGVLQRFRKCKNRLGGCLDGLEGRKVVRISTPCPGIASIEAFLLLPGLNGTPNGMRRAWGATEVG